MRIQARTQSGTAERSDGRPTTLRRTSWNGQEVLALKKLRGWKPSMGAAVDIPLAGKLAFNVTTRGTSTTKMARGALGGALGQIFYSLSRGHVRYRLKRPRNEAGRHQRSGAHSRPQESTCRRRRWTPIARRGRANQTVFSWRNGQHGHAHVWR